MNGSVFEEDVDNHGFVDTTTGRGRDSGQETLTVVPAPPEVYRGSVSMVADEHIVFEVDCW